MEGMETRAAFLAANVYSTIGGFIMRKLVPMFITTSILALAAGTAYANTSGDTTLNSDTKSYVSGEDKKEIRDETKDQTAGTTTSHEGLKAKARRAKAKVASKMHAMKHKSTTTAAREDGVSTMPTAKPGPSSDNPPTSATQGEAANSMTGKSAGR
jgi:hypothetical protein